MALYHLATGACNAFLDNELKNREVSPRKTDTSKHSISPFQCSRYSACPDVCGGPNSPIYHRFYGGSFKGKKTAQESYFLAVLSERQMVNVATKHLYKKPENVFPGKAL